MLLTGLQENLITLLAFDSEHAPIIRGVVDLSLYGGPYRTIAARIYAHLDSFKKPPGDHLPDILSDKLEAKTSEAALYEDIVHSIYAAKDGINAEYAMATLETFIKRQSLRTIAVDLQKALVKDTEASLEEAEKLLLSANKQSLSIFDPGTRLSDKKRTLKFLDLNSSAYPTGIPELDKRALGPSRKELWLLIANAKAGKCIAEGEPVLLSDGSYVPIESTGLLSTVSAFNEKSGSFEAHEAELTFNGFKEVFRLTTRTGRQITLTKNHRLLTKRGWVEVQDLNGGEAIASPHTVPVFGVNQSELHYMRILGYLIADGGLTKRATPTFSKIDSEMVDDFKRQAAKLGCTLTTSKKNKGEHWVTSYGKTNQITALLKRTGLLGKKSNAKTIPDFIFCLEKKYIAQFLSALFSCDGSIYGKKTGAVFEYSTTSPMLARQIDHLLSRFGIVAKIRERWQMVANEPYCSWSLVITGKVQIGKFESEIGLLFHKGKKLGKLTALHGVTSKRTNYICNDRLGDIFFDKVVRVEAVGKRKTYDLAVEKHHNFIAGNILVHNSWALGQLAKMALMHRLKVVHITLEMSEARSAQRYLQALFAVAKRKEPFTVTKFRKDSLGRITGFDDIKMTPGLTLDDPHIRKKLERRIDRWALRLLDNIYIKEFPTSTLTVAQLRAYLDNLEATEKFVPDLLIVDYPDLLKMDKDNYRLELDQVFKELRGIAVSRNIALAAVSQSHRSAAKAKQVGIDNVAEAYSKIAHSDTVITYTQTAQEHKLGLARLYVAAGRNDEDKFVIVISQSYNTGQFVVDSAMLRGTYWENLPPSEE